MKRKIRRHPVRIDMGATAGYLAGTPSRPQNCALSITPSSRAILSTFLKAAMIVFFVEEDRSGRVLVRCAM